MRWTALWQFFLTIEIGLLAAGCVSVNLGGGSGPHRATGVQVQPPGSPFTKEDRDDVDGAWKNSRNGNMLSYISDCQDSSDPSLETILQGAISGLNDLKVEANESPTIQGREAKRVLASGKVDGVASKIDILTFKRNKCIYILSYVGVNSSFSQDHGAFDKFVQGFRAP
jgi:hypothetical protein